MEYNNEINQIVISKKKILGITEGIKSIKISNLGAGENNLNLLVVVNKSYKFVFRIAMRPSTEKNMKNEFRYLEIIPKNYGPEPLYFDNSKKVMNAVFSVLRYIEGKHVKYWSKKYLKMHALKMAELHRRKYPFCGRLNKKQKVFDIYKKFQSEIKKYSQESSWLLNDPDIKRLLPMIKHSLKSNNHLFTSIKKFSMIHNDLLISNILFTKEGFRYIDWEWLCFRDPAKDVSKLFFKTHSLPPWRIKLTNKRLDYYLDTYLKYNPDKTLKQRIDILLDYDKFLELLYFKWKVKNYHKEKTIALSKKHYEKSIRIMVNSLKNKFLK